MLNLSWIFRLSGGAASRRLRAGSAGRPGGTAAIHGPDAHHSAARQMRSVALPLLLISAPLLADEPITMPQFVPAPAAAADSGAASAAHPAASLAAPRAAHSTDPSAEVWHQRHDLYFTRQWGVQVLGMKSVSSGWMLEFRYQVLDADKADVLNQKRSRAFVIDEVTDARLSVPAMENIGELRQTPRPQEGRIYYILFGNPGRLVKKGGHVDVVVGAFRADGMVVE